MTTDTATYLLPCPECLHHDDGDVRLIGPLDDRCPRHAALGEWSFFCDFHQHLRDFDFDEHRMTFDAAGQLTPEGKAYVDTERERVYEAAHLACFGVACSEECGAGGHRIAANQVTRYHIPSETYAANSLATFRRAREADKAGVGYEFVAGAWWPEGA